MERGGKVNLCDVNFSVGRGDFFAITGPNGGGKTTLLRIILGLLKPSQGRVVRFFPEMRIGYLPQKSSVDSRFPISVEEIVESGLIGCKGISKEQTRFKVDEALAQVEMDGMRKKAFGRLSGGQQQRALFARAIISNPQLLVLDEPLSYVDKHFEQRIYNVVEHLARTSTILLVSHDITTIAEMANRHLIVDRTIRECVSARHFVRLAYQ